jgi:hypothetical protein
MLADIHPHSPASLNDLMPLDTDGDMNRWATQGDVEAKQCQAKVKELVMAVYLHGVSGAPKEVHRSATKRAA